MANISLLPDFPGTNLQDLNLDWIIDYVRQLEQRVKRLEEIVNG